jgi:hypothetical protein
LIALAFLCDTNTRAEEPAAERIAVLVEQLGSRDAASRGLEALGEQAIPALRHARSTSDDAEVCRRAGILLDQAEGAVRLRLTWRRHCYRQPHRSSRPVLGDIHGAIRQMTLASKDLPAPLLDARQPFVLGILPRAFNA